MRRSIVSLAASGCLVALLGGTPADAAALITFVSGDGSDSLDCLSPPTACRQISFALTQTDPTGTVHVLNGEYDPFIVDKSVDIIAELGTATIGNHTAVGFPGGAASILVQSDAIVRIRGFHIYNPAIGIVSLNAEVLHVEDCVITPGGSAFGIDFRVTSGARALNVLNTIITGDGSVAGGGIIIKPSDSGSAKVVLDNTRIEDNFAGVRIDGTLTTGSNSVTVRNSTIAGSATFGLLASDSGGGTTNVIIEGSTFTHSGSHGVRVGANSTIRMRDSTVSNNTLRGLQLEGGGQIISHGGNVIAGNGTNGTFSSTVPQN